MFQDYEIRDIKNNFKLEDVEEGIQQIDEIVDREFIGSQAEAEKKDYFGTPLPYYLEQEGYYMIQMGLYGVAFDYGDTSSGGILLKDCMPYGDKDIFKTKLLGILNEMKNILSNEESPAEEVNRLLTVRLVDGNLYSFEGEFYEEAKTLLNESIEYGYDITKPIKVTDKLEVELMISKIVSISTLTD